MNSNAKICASLGLFTFLAVRAQGLDAMLAQGWKLDHAVIPLYSAGTPPHLTAKIHLDKSALEHERKGFFQIGLFPVVALVGVTFEIPDPARAPEAIARLRHWLGGEAGSRVVLRHVKFSCGPNNSIEADSLRHPDKDDWEFVGAVHLHSSARDRQGSRATLHLTGRVAGQLTLDTVPSETWTFFTTP